MRRLFGWAAGLVSIAALARLLGRRTKTAPAAEPDVFPDPADELRRRLADTRDTAPPSSPDHEEPSREPLEERRARVHAKAQAVIDEMQEDPGP